MTRFNSRVIKILTLLTVRHWLVHCGAGGQLILSVNNHSKVNIQQSEVICELKPFAALQRPRKTF